MKKYIFTMTLIIFFSLSLLGQNYIEYYNLCNEAEKELDLKNYNKALFLYETAFKKVDYIHAEKMSRAYKCAINCEKFETGFTFAKTAILKGFPIRYIKNIANRKFKRTKYYPTLIDSSTYWLNLHNSKINQKYKNIIDSLLFIDQKIIRGSNQKMTEFNINKKNLPTNLFDLDSEIFKTLLGSIEKYGFPSEQNIGYVTFANVWVLFHHNVRLPENRYYLPVLEKALKRGDYLPRDFAWMYDQGCLNLGIEPLFYFYVPTDKIRKDKNKLVAINEIRKKYGVELFTIE